MKKIIFLTMLAVLLSMSTVFGVTIASNAVQAQTTGLPGQVQGVTPIYYPAGNAVYVWGGLTSAGAFSENMSKLDLTTGTWSDVAFAAANCPAAIAGYAAVWDSDNSVIIYFGGLAKTTGRSENVSIFDPATDAWLAAGDTPSADIPAACVAAADCERSNTTAVFIPAQGMVVFGGFNDTAGAADAALWNYAYAASAGVWTRLLNTGAPSARGEHVMWYDSTNGVTYMYGGATTVAGVVVPNTADYFNLTGGIWDVDMDAGIEDPLSGAAVAYDSTADLAYLFGGYDNAAVPISSNQTYVAAGNGGIFYNNTHNGLAVDPKYQADFAGATYLNDVILVLGGSFLGTYITT